MRSLSAFFPPALQVDVIESCGADLQWRLERFTLPEQLSFCAAATLGREAAEVRGVLDDTSHVAERSAQAADALADAVDDFADRYPAEGRCPADDVLAANELSEARLRVTVTGGGQRCNRVGGLSRHTQGLPRRHNNP